MPMVKGSFSGANSDGFTHTQVSTPMNQTIPDYKTPNSSDYGNQKQQMDFELTILRRSIQNKQKFIDLR